MSHNYAAVRAGLLKLGEGLAAQNDDVEVPLQYRMLLRGESPAVFITNTIAKLSDDNLEMVIQVAKAIVQVAGE